MNLEERVKLYELEDEFVRCVSNFDSLLKLIVKYKIVTDAQKNYILKAGEVDEKRELIQTLAKRGPLAFNTFIKCLRETENDQIASELDKSKWLLGQTVKKSIYKMDYNLEKCYRMRTQPKGFVLLINIREFKNNKHELRLGSEIDLISLERLWREIGYKVICKSNLSAHDMEQCVKNFSQNDELHNVDSCVVFIMSHGESNSDKQGVSIICWDNELVHSKTLVNNFSNVKCEALAGKPKLFFFQACRGRLKDYGTHLSRSALFRRSQISLSDNWSDSMEYQRSKSAPSVSISTNLATNIGNLSLSNDNANCTSEDSVNSFEHVGLSKDSINNVHVEEILPPAVVITNDLEVNSHGQNGSTDLLSQSDIEFENRLFKNEDNEEEDLINKEVKKPVIKTVADSKKNREMDSSTEDLKNTPSTSRGDVRLHRPNSLPVPSPPFLGNISDILLIYSTHPGFCSLRDEIQGSWLVQEICNVFSEKACNHDLYDMLSIVMRNLEKKNSHLGFQLLHYENLHFNKKLFFNPGLYH